MSSQKKHSYIVRNTASTNKYKKQLHKIQNFRIWCHVDVTIEKCLENYGHFELYLRNVFRDIFIYFYKYIIKENIFDILLYISYYFV